MPEAAAGRLAAFGSSEYAKVVLGGCGVIRQRWILRPKLDLHKLLREMAARGLMRSARDISDGGIAVSLAQAAFGSGIGATIDQDPSLMIHPLFGLFAEPATTMLVTADAEDVAQIEKLAEKYNFFAARIGTTGGTHLEITVDRQPFISAPLASLRKPWASALEATLHNEVTA